ncbi:MAG: triose-phosphate isomerase family protein, partial [Bacteroidota bacterium]
LEAGLKVIYCVGETLAQRQSGDHFDIILSQLSESLYHVPPALMSRVVVAYEPVWAIGTGVTATPDQAQEMHAFIRKSLFNQFGADLAENTRILYGGSCNESNAKTLFSLPDIDGGLIGGASLNSRSFVNILKCS